MTQIAIIGSGFSGLSAAAFLAKKGLNVEVFEKNSQLGGRARQWVQDGFVFDMGPSWYWMPEVFENFYNHFGYTTGDFYKLVRLEPSFRIYFGKDSVMNIPSDFDEVCELFERTEKGGADKLRMFMKGAAFKYETGIQDLVYKPGLSLTEFLDKRVLSGVFKLDVFSSFSKHVRSYFKDPRLISLMEFPVLFLGAKPSDTPALYSLMNYAGLKLGTWYPMGGMGEIVNAMKTIAESQGAKFYADSPVSGFDFEGNSIRLVKVNDREIPVRSVVASADYQHVESLLPLHKQSYKENYWSSRVMAPSSLIFYLGVKKKLPSLVHHNLFFDEDFALHADEIYTRPAWPSRPLFYICCPSKTDPSVAPEECENLFILMPLAPGLRDEYSIREKYFQIIMERFEKLTGEKIEKEDILVKRSYCISDFVQDYNSFKGNAYGLANTLRQTAILKPSIKSKKVNNLYFTGQLTVPGPGVPPAIISGQIVASQLMKELKNLQNETAF